MLSGQRHSIASYMGKQAGRRREVHDDWRLAMRAWFDRPDAPSKREVAKKIDCDPSELTVLLRLSTDTPRGPSTSTIAEKLANYAGIPLVLIPGDEFSESSSLF